MLNYVNCLPPTTVFANFNSKAWVILFSYFCILSRAEGGAWPIAGVWGVGVGQLLIVS